MTDDQGRGTGEQPRRIPWSDLLHALMPVWAVLVALLLGAILLALLGRNPVAGYSALLRGAFGSTASLGVTFNKTTPLLLAGLGVLFAFRCGVWNIGIEGQLYLGGLGATLVGITFRGLPAVILLPMALGAAALFGALWALLPAMLKAYRGVNEIISTILMNYMAILFISYMVNGPIKDPAIYYPESPRVDPAAVLPIVLPGSHLHAGLLVGLVAVFLTFFVLWRTTLGYQVRAVGVSPATARYAGISVERNIIVAMLISGALAGLAGGSEILGLHHRLIDFFSPGYGFDAIAVALLGALQPFGVLLAALFFGGLRAGAGAMQRSIGIPTVVVYVIQALAVIFVVGTAHVRLFPRLTRRGESTLENDDTSLASAP